MSRLASGSRVEVSKKEMKALTNKNYENLPEVRKKKEDEQKKLELRKRLEMARKIKKWNITFDITVYFLVDKHSPFI